MVRGKSLEALVRRLDRALNGLEATALGRLSVALRRSEAALEELLRPAYARALTEVVDASTAMREARARLLLEQVRAALDITSGAPADDVLRALVSDAYEVGAGNALDALSLYQREVVSLSSGVRADVLARATNASARLSRHGREFAEKAEQLIIDGITRGRGWTATARELRRETRTTLARAEMIVRTESITASDDARRAAYAENGVQYVQRMATMDDRVCGWCAYRAGNVYRVDEAPVALHPGDRCYNAPWKPEWQEAGLTDDEWFRQHRAEAIERSGDDVHRGVAPFEKANGVDAPTPVWTP